MMMNKLIFNYKLKNIISVICRNSTNNIIESHSKLYIRRYSYQNNNNIDIDNNNNQNQFNNNNQNFNSEWIQSPKITVCGVGGGGCNSVNNMIKKKLFGVDLIVANTDAQALAISESEKVVQLGKSLTKGLGAGALPHIGKQAAEESIEEILNQIGNSQMLFVTAGMGGGTGTGGAPVIAAAAKERGILTVGIVTKPFQFEGRHRMKLADQGLAELEKAVDSLIVIPNQKLMDISNDLYIGNAFQMVDDVLYNGIKGISDILTKPGIVNLDFADVRSIMCNSGKALMGVGEAEGKDRDNVAAQMALNNPLLENIDISGAKGVLLNISGDDIKLQEVNKIVSLVSSKVDPSANIIFGSTFDKVLDGKIRVTLIVTGMNDQVQQPPAQQQVIINHQQTTQQQQQPIQQQQQPIQQQQQQQILQQPVQQQQQPIPQQVFSNYQQPIQQQQYQQPIQQQPIQQQQQQYQQPIQQQPIQQEQPKSRFFSFARFFQMNTKPKNTTPGSNWD